MKNFIIVELLNDEISNFEANGTEKYKFIIVFKNGNEISIEIDKSSIFMELKDNHISIFDGNCKYAFDCDDVLYLVDDI